jgi:hypothetical protein
VALLQQISARPSSGLERVGQRGEVPPRLVRERLLGAVARAWIHHSSRSLPRRRDSRAWLTPASPVESECAAWRTHVDDVAGRDAVVEVGTDDAFGLALDAHAYWRGSRAADREKLRSTFRST